MKDYSIFYDMQLDSEQKVFVEAMMNPEKLIVFCDARAGTGKTTLAMGAANLLYKDNRIEYDGVVYVVSPYGEQKQGYLPGNQTAKSEVYFEPAYQAIAEIGLNPFVDVCTESLVPKKGAAKKGEAKKVEAMKKGEGFIRLLTHTYLRGSNLAKKIIIIDEAQNFTAAELKKVLTRIHDDCKVIVIGHTGQIDIYDNSGFERYLKHFEKEAKCQVCRLTVNHRGWISSFADELPE